jgi:hypothetical protein
MQLKERFGLGFTECRTPRQVRSNGDEALVFITPKDVSGIAFSIGH